LVPLSGTRKKKKKKEVGREDEARDGGVCRKTLK